MSPAASQPSIADPSSPLLAALAAIEQAESAFASWDDEARAQVDRYRRALDDLHREALRRLISALRDDRQASAALRAAVEDEIVHAVLRYHQLLKPSLNERIEQALGSVRPALALHGGDVALVAIDPPRATVRLTGTCDDCSASMLTFSAGVRKAVLDACPEITEVVQARDGALGTGRTLVSPFADTPGPWHDAGTIADMDDGGVRALEREAVPLLLYRHGETVTCFQDACGHLGRRLSGGPVEDGIITCPHHGFRYDLATGACLTANALALQSLPVRIVDGAVELWMPV